MIMGATYLSLKSWGSFFVGVLILRALLFRVHTFGNSQLGTREYKEGPMSYSQYV